MSLVELVDARMAFHIRHKQARERMGCGSRTPRVDDRMARLIEQKRAALHRAEESKRQRQEAYKRRTRGATIYLTPIGPKLPDEEPPSIRDIQNFVACSYGLARADLLSPSKKSKLIEPRHVAMYLSIKTGRGTSEVGRAFHRDHSSAWNALEKISNTKDAELLLRVRELAKLLGVEVP